MSQDWYYLESDASSAALNMAWDEALLSASVELGRPVLRFYSWAAPAASFGFFQKFAEVTRLTPVRPLVRRPTGGGLVLHLSDWTYSVVIPPDDPWYSIQAKSSYCQIHHWIKAALAAVGTATELCPVPLRLAHGQCFVGAEQFDLLWHGQKIAGAAQRRTKNGLLIQGSIQPPPAGICSADWHKAMRSAGSEDGKKWSRLEPGPELAEAATALAQQKFSQPAYNQRR